MESVADSRFSSILQYLYATLPMFQRVGASAYKKDLGNTLALLQALGNPHHSLKTIHVAGTNGKGSVSSLLSSIFQESGYTTGLYTSPHLLSFTERIRINGVPIPQTPICDWVEKYKPLLEDIKPSFFETTVALCLDWFAHQSVEIAIIETGLGGRLDSTNVITPELSIITNISWDHMDLLGNSLSEIAYEKAGIIKSACPVVIGQKRLETQRVFEQKAEETSSQIYWASDTVALESVINPGKYARWKDTISGKIWDLDLMGGYQRENLATVLTAIPILTELGWNLPEAAIQEGVKKVRENTGLRGRMEQLREHPRVVLDTGHNEAGVQEVLEQLRQGSEKQWHIVWGMVGDKDRSKVLALLPPEARYYWVKPDLPRGLSADVLSADAQQYGLKGDVYASVALGIEAALQVAQSQDLIYIGGSTFVVAEALAIEEKVKTFVLK